MIFDYLMNLAAAGLILVSPVYERRTQEGAASYYSTRTNGRVTASGTPLSDRKMTAAHKTLPFGSVVRVTNLSNKKAVTVTITDRGPYVKRRVIDLSVAAARSLGIVKTGVARVKIQVMSSRSFPNLKRVKQG